MADPTPTAEPESCGNCYFWRGACKRYPLQYIGDRQTRDGTEPAWSYPPMGETDWCGEWKPKR